MLPETNDFSIFTTISPFLYIDCLYIVYLYIISNIYLCQGILSPYLTSFFHFNRKKYAQNSSFQNRSVHSFLFSFYFSFSVLLFTRIFQLYSAIMQSSPAFSKTSFSLPFPIRTVTFFYGNFYLRKLSASNALHVNTEPVIDEDVKLNDGDMIVLSRKYGLQFIAQ